MRVKGSLIADNSGIGISAGDRVLAHDTRLVFNPRDFYLSKNTLDNPVVNLGGDRTVFSGCMVRVDSDNSLVSAVTETLTFGPEIYDIGGWFDSASSTTNFVVPAGVSRVIVFANIGYTPSGGGPSNAYFTTVVLRNGATFPTGANTAFRVRPCNVTGFQSTTTFSMGPLDVSPGNIITFTVAAVYATSTSVSVIAANSYAGVYAV